MVKCNFSQILWKALLLFCIRILCYPHVQFWGTLIDQKLQPNLPFARYFLLVQGYSSFLKMLSTLHFLEDGLTSKLWTLHLPILDLGFYAIPCAILKHFDWPQAPTLCTIFSASSLFVLKIVIINTSFAWRRCNKQIEDRMALFRSSPLFFKWICCPE